MVTVVPRRALPHLTLLALSFAGCMAAPDDEGIYLDDQEVVSQDYPSAEWLSASTSNFASGRAGPIQYIVVHDIEGSYDSARGWFRNPSAEVSAHYVIRSSDGAVTQMVRDRDTAWHAGSSWMNARSIGIEHEGYVDQPRYFTEAMYRSSARLVAHLARRHGIPLDEQHILGHVNVVARSSNVCSPANTWNYCRANNNGNHTDPGPSWNWAHYLSLIREYARGAGPAPAPDPAPPAPGCGAYARFTLWNCVGRAEMVRCVGGRLQRATCAGECVPRPDGVNDVCTPMTNLGACGARAGFTVWNCEGNRRTMVRCIDGRLYRVSCSRGCSARPDGVSDVCD